MSSLTTKITAALTGTLLKTRATGLDSSYAISQSYSQQYASGVGNAQTDKFYDATITLVASGVTTLDLSGALVDPLGTTTVFVTVKAILISAASANTANLIIGASATFPWIGPFDSGTSSIALKPGGVFLIANPNAGWTVAAGTGDLLAITNASGSDSQTYTISIMGTSA